MPAPAQPNVHLKGSTHTNTPPHTLARYGMALVTALLTHSLALSTVVLSFDLRCVQITPSQALLERAKVALRVHSIHGVATRRVLNSAWIVFMKTRGAAKKK
jgi:hypothetical protein